MEVFLKVKQASKNPKNIAILNKRQEEITASEGMGMKQCTYFISRKSRFCARRSISCLIDYCTEHSPEALERSLDRDRLARENFINNWKTQMALLPNSCIRKECEGAISSILNTLVGISETIEVIDCGQHTSKKRSRRSKRVSAPKRMANPSSLHLTPKVQDMHTSWTDIYKDLSRPLHIDVGCAKGKCIEALAQKAHRISSWNHLGLEIRADLVRDKPGTSNLYFLACNFLGSASDFMSTLPTGRVRLVSIQFPDPWRRRKHENR